MKIRAAVAREINKLQVEEVELESPHEGEVLVRIHAAGVCHSDLHTFRGELRATPPIVLGHEGAGVVESVGPGVTRVQPGQRVMINWLPSCLECPSCLAGQPTLCEQTAKTTLQALTRDGTTRHKTADGMDLKPYLGSATMGEYAVVHQNGIVPLPDDVPFEIGAVIGCAVLTGVGAVLNTAETKPGSSAAVIGCGGVGLSILLGCVLAGCDPLIAVDVVPDKLAFARELGATHTVNGREEDVVQALRSLTHRGPDYVFDSVGAPPTMAQALNSARPGGTAVVTGMASLKDDVPISAAALIAHNKRFLGCFAGSGRPLVDLPKLIDLYRSGKLPVDRLITNRYELNQVNRAFEDMEAGKVARSVLVME